MDKTIKRNFDYVGNLHKNNKKKKKKALLYELYNIIKGQDVKKY